MPKPTVRRVKFEKEQSDSKAKKKSAKEELPAKMAPAEPRPDKPSERRISKNRSREKEIPEELPAKMPPAEPRRDKPSERRISKNRSREKEIPEELPAKMVPAGPRPDKPSERRISRNRSREKKSLAPMSAMVDLDVDEDVDKVVDKVEEEKRGRQVMVILKKMKMDDQITLRRCLGLLPMISNDLWRTNYWTLDFRILYQELPEESQRNYLLSHMANHYTNVYFVATRLQDNLNTLEQAKVRALSKVERLELWVPDDLNTGKYTKSEKYMPQWPLHALPKLLRNVRRLKIRSDVDVHFIEHFPLLELVMIYGSISQTALTGIFERCHRLRRLFLRVKCCPENLTLKSIRKCPKLRDVSVPMVLFAHYKELVIGIKGLRMLELTLLDSNVKRTLDCMRYIINQKYELVEQVQVDCRIFAKNYIDWMCKVGLERCDKLRGLVLVNCTFGNREISELGVPIVHKYIVLYSCYDIKEYQVMDMVRRCPNLSELYLIDCPQLSWKLLQGLYRQRRAYGIGFPLSVVLGQCPVMRADYQTMYSNYWCFKKAYIKIERVQDDSKIIEDMQIFFYPKPPKKDSEPKSSTKQGPKQD